MTASPKVATGRPPLAPNRLRRNLSITLDPELASTVDMLAKRTGFRRSRVIEEMLLAGRDATIKKLLGPSSAA